MTRASKRAGKAVALAALSLIAAPAGAARGPLRGALPPAALNVGIEEHVGQSVPADLAFRDQDGQPVHLRDYLHHGRPVVLVLAYYRCPMLCDLVLRGLANAFAEIGWTPGRQADLLTVSIDPQDTPAAALLKQGHVLQALGRPEAKAGWPFLVGDAASSRALADAMGFRYVYDPTSHQYAHAAGAVVLTPEGRFARYVYGVQFRPFDLRLALTEAGQGKVGGIVERVLLTCFRYDPSARRYGIYVVGLLKGGGALVLLTVGICLGVLWRREAVLRREELASKDAPEGEGRR
ncbi:MAG: SCO family protein [Pseudomonadota bacterium]